MGAFHEQGTTELITKDLPNHNKMAPSCLKALNNTSISHSNNLTLHP